MCNPLAMGVAMAASTGVDALSQDRLTRETNSYQSAVFKNARFQADRSAVTEHEALAARSFEERAVRAKEIESVGREAAMARGAARAAKLEGGAAGGSLKAIERDLLREEADFKGSIAISQKFSDAQFLRESRGIFEQRNARVEAAKRAKTPRPNFLNTLLSIGTSGLGGYAAAGGFDQDGAP